MANKDNKVFDDVEYPRMKRIATSFFYWWYNQPGQNTSEGFDDWWEKEGYKI